jgi:hypothetical protein
MLYANVEYLGSKDVKASQSLFDVHRRTWCAVTHQETHHADPKRKRVSNPTVGLDRG